MRALALLLLLAAPLAAQEPQDSMMVTDIQITRSPIPVSVIVRDTTPATLDISMTVSAEQQMREYMQRHECCSSGPPWWFWAGSLALGAGALYVWHNREVSQTTIINEQSQEQTTEGAKLWWPWHGKKKGHHEE